MTHVSTIYGPSGQKETVFLAKLEGVMALVDAISYQGVQYDRTSGEAVVGDVIRFDDRSSYVTTGGFYEVVRIDEADDPQIIDDDGDEFDLCGEDHTVFKRAKASVSDVVTHKGVQYRKTTRTPRAGDVMIAIMNDPADGYKTGFITVSNADGWFKDVDGDNRRLGAHADRFVALERIETPLTLPSDYIVHNGEVYRKEARKAAAGDLIYVVDAEPNGTDRYKNGDILTVKAPFSSGSGGVQAEGVHNGLYRFEYVTLAPVTSITIAGTTYNVEKRRANVGEAILVVNASLSSGYGNGDVLSVKTSKVAGGGYCEHVTATADKRLATLWTKEYVVLTPQMVKAPEPSQTSGTQYREVNRVAKAGERIRIVNASTTMGKYANGDEFVVKRSPHPIGSYRNGGKGNGVEVDKFGLIVMHDEYVVLEPIETPKIDEATARRRAVKVGDRVRVTVDCGGHPVGTIGTVTEVRPVNYAEKDNSVRVEANGRTWAERNVEPVDETPVCTPSRDTAPATSKQRYNAGDYVKVVRNEACHNYEIGSVVKIATKWEGFLRDGYRAQRSDGSVGNILRDKEIVPATDAEIDAAKRSAFAKGDTVRLVSGGGVHPLFGFDNGKTYVVVNNDYSHGSGKNGKLVKITYTDGTSVGFATPDQLVKVTSETAATSVAPCCAPSRQQTVETPKPLFKVGDRVKLTVPAGKDARYGWGGVKNGEIGTVKYVGKALSVTFPSQSYWSADPSELTLVTSETPKNVADAKWAEIGRKKDEYRVGDVVAITRDQCGDPVGSVVEIVTIRLDGDSVRYASRKAASGTYAASVDAITMVVPVEQRFDKRV